MALAMVLPAAAPAQQMEDAHNNLFADHNSGGSNGATRLGARIGGMPSAHAQRPAAPLAQPANSGIHVYQPRSLNDVARDWAKAHPHDLPNRRKPEPQ
jgi:hypothetical protein